MATILLTGCEPPALKFSPAPTVPAIPMAIAQSLQVSATAPTSITIAGTGLNGGALATGFVVAAAPAHGTLSGTAPQLIYTPVGGYFGADTFQFTVQDGTKTSLPATVSLTVVPPPTSAFSAPSRTTINAAASVIFTVAYAYVSTITLSASDVIVTTSGGATCGTPVISGTGLTTRAVTVGSCSGNGSFTLRLAASTAHFSDGNQAPAAGPTAAVTVDNTVPTVVLSSAVSTPTNVNPISIAVTASKILPGLAFTDFTVSGGSAQTLAGTAPNYTLQVVPSGDGSVSIQLGAAKARDASGNATAATNALSWVYDATAPTPVTSVTHAAAYSSTSASPAISWTGGGVDSGSGLNRFEYSLGTSVGATNTKAWTSAGTARTVTVAGLSLTDGTRYFVNVRAIDNAGNVSSVASSSGWVADITPPVVTMTNFYEGAGLSGPYTITGACESNSSGTVSITYPLGFVLGPSSATCTGNVFSAAISTTRTLGKAQIGLSQTDAAGNVGTLTRNLASLGEYITIPANYPSFNSLPNNYVNQILPVGSAGKIFAATNLGLAISSDGGSTWVTRTISNGIPDNVINSVAVSADASQIFVATSGGVSISNDGGFTFSTSAAAKALGAVTRVVVNGSGTSANIYAATASGLGISINDGVSFALRAAAQLGTTSSSVVSVSLLGSGSTTELFVGTLNGLAISSDNGATFTNHVIAPGQNNTVSAVAAFGTVGNAQLVLAMGIGTRYSTNNGTSYTFSNVANSNYGSRDVVYASGEIFAATPQGVTMSTDGGATFSAVLNLGTGMQGYVQNVYATGSGSSTQLYFGTNEGLYLSANNGLSYTPVRATSLPQIPSVVTFSGTGSGTNIFAIVGGDLSTPDLGLYASRDAGLSFVPLIKSTSLAGFVSVSAAGTGSSAQIWATYAGALHYSSDGGQTFTIPAENGIPNGTYFYTTFVLGSGSTAQIYAWASGATYISNDNGANFTVSPLPPSFTYAYGSGSTTQVLTYSDDDGIYYSHDNGTTVTHYTAGGAGSLPTSTIRSVSIASNGAGTTLYAATDLGLAVSTNYGATFTKLGTANGLLYDAADSVFATFGPANILYVGSPGIPGTLAISSNGGTSFTNKSIADGISVPYGYMTSYLPTATSQAFVFSTEGLFTRPQ